MNYRFQALLNQAPGALERMIRVIRVRGFVISQLSMAIEEKSQVVTFECSGERSINSLFEQLRKLNDIDHCEMTDQAVDVRKRA